MPPFAATRAAPDILTDPNWVVVLGEQELPPGTTVLHGFGPVEWAGKLFARKKEDVRADWEKIVGQVGFMLEGTSAVLKEYELSEIGF